MSQVKSEDLLREYQAIITQTGGKRKASVAKTVGSMWEYLFKSPGEQRPYAEFGAMFGVKESSAFSRIKTLINHGVITKTSGRKGTGGGAGFCCPWLEEKRGNPIPAATTPPAAGSPTITSGGLKVELVGIETIAERGVQAMRQITGHDSNVGFAVIEALREIQARANRVMSSLAK